MRPLRRFALRLLLAVASLAATAVARSGRAPKLDPKRIINESYNFRKNHEPEMSEEEHTLYEKIVQMIAVQPELALKLLETLTSGAEQKSPAFEFVLGNVYYSNSRLDLAEQHFRKALEKFPEFTRAWANLGALLYGQGKYEEAAVCFTKTIEHGDRDAQTLGLLAYCLDHTGRRIAAEMDYIQALGLEPDNPDFLEGLVALYYDDGQFARAEALMKHLIKVSPQEHRHWPFYASLVALQGRATEAISILEAADSLRFLEADGLLLLGDLYAKQQCYREAADAYIRLRSRAPALGEDNLLNLTQSLIAGQQLRPAEETLAAINFDLSPKNRILYLQARADLFSARKAWPQAQKELETLLALEPLNGRALLALGKIYKANADFAHADLVLESATQLPEFAYLASLELADVALKTRRYARGLDYLERAASIEKSLALDQYIASIRLIVPDRETSPSHR